VRRPCLDGNRPSFSVATLALSVALTTSTPSTVSTVAPGEVRGRRRRRRAGSVYATLTERGGLDAITRNWAPYPGSTPDCDNATHWAVGYVKWNRSFGLPEGVVAVVFSTLK